MGYSAEDATEWFQVLAWGWRRWVRDHYGLRGREAESAMRGWLEARR